MGAVSLKKKQITSGLSEGDTVRISFSRPTTTSNSSGQNQGGFGFGGGFGGGLDGGAPGGAPPAAPGGSTGGR